jgi:hypothetical protein
MLTMYCGRFCCGDEMPFLWRSEEVAQLEYLVTPGTRSAVRISSQVNVHQPSTQSCHGRIVRRCVVLSAKADRTSCPSVARATVRQGS